MAYAVVVHGAAWSTDSNGFTTGGTNGGGTASLDTTGADLIVVVLGVDGTAPVAGDLTDNKGNAYSMRTVQSSGTRRVVIYYKQGPSVGTGHTWSIAGTTNYPSLCISSWSGSGTTPFDVENGGVTAFGTTVATGSVTPSTDNQLLITGESQAGYTAPANTIDSSFTILDQVSDTSFGHSHSFAAYQIQTTATARNPTVTASAADTMEAAIATFKAAAAAATGNPPSRRTMRGMG